MGDQQQWAAGWECALLSSRGEPGIVVFAMASPDEIARMSKVERVAEALRRSIPHLPAEGRAMVTSMLEPTSLAVIGGTLVVWIGSHAFGIGEFVDLVLLGAGVVVLGFSALEGADCLYDFVKLALGARSDSDLEQAGQSFARAVLLLGVSTVQAILLHGQARAALARGAPKAYPRPEVAPHRRQAMSSAFRVHQAYRGVPSAGRRASAKSSSRVISPGRNNDSRSCTNWCIVTLVRGPARSVSFAPS